MKLQQGSAAALLLLLSGTGIAAAAGPRAPPPPWKDPIGPPVAMNVWLPRLVGTYDVEGVIEVVFYPEHMCGPLPPGPDEEMPSIHVPYCTSIKGKIDCAAVGAGPGVQCIFNVTWLDLYETSGANLPGGVAWLSPAMALFGLDTGEAALSYLLVDHKGLPEGGLGHITGNRATFRTPCVNAPTLFQRMGPQDVDNRKLTTCDRTIRIDARPDARLVHLSMDIEINDVMFTRIEMNLRRQQQRGQ